MTTDVTNVQFAFMMIIRLAIRSPLMLVFAFVMAFMMGGKMAWIFLFVLPVLAAGLAIIISKTIPLFRRVFKKYDKLNESIQENVKAMRVVKAFVREDYESKKFGTAAEDVCADFTRAERILALNGSLMQFCIYSVMVFVLSFGSYTIVTSMGLDFDVGQLSALLTYSFMMLSSLMMLSMVFVMITMAGRVHEAYYRGAQRKEHAYQPRKSCIRGYGRFYRLRRCELPLLRKGRAHGALEH